MLHSLKKKEEEEVWVVYHYINQFIESEELSKQYKICTSGKTYGSSYPIVMLSPTINKSAYHLAYF